MPSILFVCTANICRSPMAESVMREILARSGAPADKLAKVLVQSAGTHDYQAGKPPFEMAVAAARRRGYELGARVARPVCASDFERFDYILAMDMANLAHLRTICPTRYKQKVELLLEYGDKYQGQEVPDPYGGNAKGYERAIDMIEDGCHGLALLIGRSL